MAKIMSLAALLVYLSSGFSQSDKISLDKARIVPRLLNYQVFVTDTLSIPVTANLNMDFAIYDQETAGNLFWSETQAGIAIESGLFHVLLGNVNPIPDSVFFMSDERWLQLSIAGQTVAPRTRITAVGYAYSSTFCDTAEYARNVSSGADGDWTISGSNMYSAVPGNIGIGTSTPQAKLDIKGDLALSITAFTATEGNNNDIAIGPYSTIKISGPLNNYSITGISGGVDGRIIILYNNTPKDMFLQHDDSNSLPGNRIYCCEEGQFSVKSYGAIIMMYDGTTNYWLTIVPKKS